MAILGLGDLKDTNALALWDLSEAKRVMLADGRSFDEVVQELVDMTSELNQALLEDPHYSGLMAVQDDPLVEYATGSTSGVKEAGEYSAPNPVTGSTTGHSIGTKIWDRGLGWTRLGLMDRRSKQIEADVRGAVTDIRNHFQQRALRRFFLSTAERVGGTNGASVPLADGGTADSDYVPMDSPKGQKFNNTHNHFLRYASLDQTTVNAAIEHLKEHGHIGPFDIVASDADAETWATLTGWKKPQWDGLMYNSTNEERANINGVEIYGGYVETPHGIARVWFTPRLPTNYFGAYKVYAPLDPRNPLRLRFDPKLGYGWQIAPGIYLNAPQLMAVLMARFDFGVGEDRTNGVCVYINGSGSYVDPNIT